jgi:hypothetical protein
VVISDITMENVATPFHFTLKRGNTAGRISVIRVKATGVYRAASSVESWAETPFAEVVFRDVSIEYTGGGTAEQARIQVKEPGVDARPLPAWGFFLRNVKKLSLDKVRFNCVKEDLRPVLIGQGVAELVLDGVTFPRLAAAADPLVLGDVGQVQLRDGEVPTAQPQCADLTLVAAGPDGQFRAGKPFSIKAIVENPKEEGLAKIEVTVADQKVARWVWLRAKEKKEVVFAGMVAPAEGTHEVRCAGLTKSLAVGM